MHRDSAEIVLWSHNMHNSSKDDHSHNVSHECSETDDHGELLEEQQVSKEKDSSTEEGCGTSRGDTETHLSVALLHLLESGGLK